MFHNDFEYLLERSIGLDAASIGASAVERAVKERLGLCALDDVHAYWDLVRSSPAELQALIEAVVVPETWFFRDPEAFAELARHACEEWLPRGPQGTLRLLSLPCSSGEEPYSMAMALLDAGFPLDRCRIDAIDVSVTAVQRARGAVYGKNSFRGADLAFRDRHFEPNTGGYRLGDPVRRPVTFQQGNLLANDFLLGSEPYDIIFCRNLLIYFAQVTQDEAVKVLDRLLKPSGLVFGGPSEGGLLLEHGFVSRKIPLAFAFCRAGKVEGRRVPSPARTRHRRSAQSAEPARPAERARLAPSTCPPPPSAVTVSMSTPATLGRECSLDEAHRLADRGHMPEAAEACEEHLRRNRPSARAFFLLGLIRSATGSIHEAERYYRKALYLDRHHHEALVHLQLLLRNQGDFKGAEALEERLRRLVRKSEV